MKFSIVYDEILPGCYVAGKMGAAGSQSAIFASEQEGDGPILRIYMDTLEKEILSEKPGGCMNVVELEKERGSYLAIQKFFPIFKSEQAVIVWGRKEEQDYQCKEVQKLPFVHRIDVISYGGDDYLLAASLCETKKNIDDWDYPGSIYAGRIDYENREITGFRKICEDIFKNHGFTKIGAAGEGGVLVSGDCGVFLLTPPGTSGGEWKKEIYIDAPASDAVIVDMNKNSCLDEKSYLEMGVIEPFHGNKFRIYERKEEKWKIIYELPGHHEFGHAIWGGMFNGQKAFIVGFRAAEKELYLITMQGGKYTAELIEKGAGSANVTVVHTKKDDYICSANRESNRCTIYMQVK